MDPNEDYLPPPILAKPSWEIAKSSSPGKRRNKDVVFDLETTGFDSIRDQITQIAAITTDQKHTFNVYVMPSKLIPKAVSELTGLEIRSQGGIRHMLSKGRVVETVTLKQGLKSFIEFLKKVAESDKINLLGHNCIYFDMLFIHQALIKTNLLTEFEEIVGTITDTLHVFKQAMPGRKSYKQQDLFKEVFQEKYSAHNALEDVKALARLVLAVKKSYIEPNTYSYSSVIARMEFYRQRRAQVQSLYVLVNGNVITMYIAKKMAETGIGFSHLKEAYDKGNDAELRMLLSAANKDGRPRVTKSKQIIETLCAYFRRKNDECASDADSLADQLAGLKV